MKGRTDIIISEQVRLGLLHPDDAGAIYRTINTQRKYLGEWLPFVESTTAPGDTERFVAGAVAAAEAGYGAAYTIRYNTVFAGLIGFKDTDLANRKTEIGYWLSSDFQGRGIITNAIKALLNLTFGEMQMNRVQIKCAVGNTRSRNIPVKLGFTLEGVERAGERHSGETFVDLEVFSMLKSEWERRIG